MGKRSGHGVARRALSSLVGVVPDFLFGGVVCECRGGGMAVVCEPISPLPYVNLGKREEGEGNGKCFLGKGHL